MLQRAIKRIPLRRPQFLEIGEHPLAAIRTAMRTAEVARHILAGEDGLSYVVGNHEGVRTITRACKTDQGLGIRDSSSSQIASANSLVVAAPPRSRVVREGVASTRNSADSIRPAAADAPI